MVQINTMIFWAEPQNEEINVVIKKAYDTLQLLKEFGTEISPNYLTVLRKKDAKLFEWSYERFVETIEKKIKKRGENSFSDLGYSLSFFSSLIEKDSASIGITFGISDPKFFNTFIVNLPESMEIHDDIELAERISCTFKKCIDVFKPFWGCISNKANSRRYDGYMKDDLPTTTHWMNYWGEGIINRLGFQKFNNVPSFNSENLYGGYFFKLKEFPINDNDPDDILLQKKINEYFELIN